MIGQNQTQKNAQIKRIIRMKNALVNDDKETQKQIVREHLSNMWVSQLSNDINNVYGEF